MSCFDKDIAMMPSFEHSTSLISATLSSSAREEATDTHKSISEGHGIDVTLNYSRWHSASAPSDMDMSENV